jgi:hypothetical protein
VLLGVSVGSLIGLLAGILGSIYIYSIRSHSGAPSIVVAHPQLEVFGFLATFITGVASLLLPKFNLKRPRPFLAAWAISLYACGSLLWVIRPASIVLGDALSLAGAVLSSTMIFTSLSRPRNPLGYGNLFFGAAGVTLILTLSFLTYFDASGHAAPQSFPLLELAGFPTTMIFGVQLQTVRFKRAPPNLLFARTATGLWATFLLACGLSIYAPTPSLVLLSSILFSAGGLYLLGGLNAFRRATKPTVWALNENMHRLPYFDASSRIAAYWFAASALFLVADALIHKGYWRSSLTDAYVHSLAVGYLMTTIMGYAPILLPGLLGTRVKDFKTQLSPLLLVSAGNAWRIVGDVSAGVSGGANYLYSGYSFLPVLVGAALFLIQAHSAIIHSKPVR